MKTIIVDNNLQECMLLGEKIKHFVDIKLIGKFDSASDAIEFVNKNEVVLAFINIQMKDVNGVELAKILKVICPTILFVFITDHEDNTVGSIKLNAAGYLVKPYTQEELAYVVESALLLSRRKMPKLFARTFGHFDFFVNGKPIMFKSAKAKELLALLIDRQGGTVTSDQIIATLWEDRPNDDATQSLTSKIVKTLQEELANAGVVDLVIVSRGVKRIDTERFECDLYELLAGNEIVLKNFMGDYLVDYSWAESRASTLVQVYKKELFDNY